MNDDERVNEVLDVFLQAVANKVLEIAHRPDGPECRFYNGGLGTTGRFLTHPNIATIVAIKSKRKYGRTGA